MDSLNQSIMMFSADDDMVDHSLLNQSSTENEGLAEVFAAMEVNLGNEMNTDEDLYQS